MSDQNPTLVKLYKYLMIIISSSSSDFSLCIIARFSSSVASVHSLSYSSENFSANLLGRFWSLKSAMAGLFDFKRAPAISEILQIQYKCTQDCYSLLTMFSENSIIHN